MRHRLGDALAGRREVLIIRVRREPRDDDWRAAFGVFDTERSVMEFYRVPYTEGCAR